MLKNIFFICAFIGFTCLYAAQVKPVRVISSSPTQLSLEINIQNWSMDSITTDNAIYQSLSFPGAQHDQPPGAPDIPSLVIPVGVPAQGQININIANTQSQRLDPVQLAPAPRSEVHNQDVSWSYNPDPEIYNRSEFAPNTLINRPDTRRLRSIRYVPIRVYLLQYNPKTQNLRRYNRITLTITFPQTGQSTKPAAYDEQLDNLLINYDQARLWAATPQQRLEKAQTQLFHGSDWYKITISGNGGGGMENMYKLTGKILKDKGVPVESIDPATLQLFNNGGRMLNRDIVNAVNDTLIENPIKIVGAKDGRLDDNDYILFYGRSLEGVAYDSVQNRLFHYIHRFDYDNAFWLTYGKQTGKRMQQKSSLPTQGLDPQPAFRDLVWIEEERHNIYNSGTIWLGRELSREVSSWSVNFDLHNPLNSEPTQARVSLAPTSGQNETYRFYMNGNSIGSTQTSGTGLYLRELEYDAQGTLMDAENTFTLSYVAASNASFAYVNWVELEFGRTFTAKDNKLFFRGPLGNQTAAFELEGFDKQNISIFDVTDMNTAQIIPESQNGSIRFADNAGETRLKRYLALSPDDYAEIEPENIESVDVQHLRSERNIDFIIITYKDFYQQALELESLRENWDPDDRLETEVVQYASIVNEFGWGISDPEAVRRFLAWAQMHWNQPGYVLLFGDGHFDYKNILRHDTPNLIPPYEIDGVLETSSRVSDDWFAYTSGQEQGMQMAVGRLCVTSVDEAQAVVDKIVSYETDPPYEEWMNRITFLADDELIANGKSSGVDFVHMGQSEQLSRFHTPEVFNQKKVYLVDYPAVPSASVSGVTKPAASQALLEQINRGTLILNFIGHGNDNLLTHERVFKRSDHFDQVRNDNRLALWVAATCEFAYWDQPFEQSFAEDLVNARGRGALALIGSARLAFASPNAAFNYNLFDNIFVNYKETGHTTRLGDAVLLSKLEMSTGFYKENTEKFLLLGDPTLRLQAPQHQAVIDDLAPDSIKALGKTSLSGHIEQNGSIWPDFSGNMLVRVMDTQIQKSYHNPELDRTTSYLKPGNTLFNGQVTVENGRFDVNFIVPKDISYGGDQAKISLYFWNHETSGAGIRNNLVVSQKAVDLEDQKGPEMHLHFGDPNFISGDLVSQNPTLHVELADSISGINTAGSIGHQITMTLNDNFNQSTDLTEYFKYDEGSFVNGSLEYPIFELEPGEHSMTVKAWDNSNNSSVTTTYFTVIHEKKLEIKNVVTWPNPMRESCTFRFQLSQNAEVSIKIYTLAGRMVQAFDALPMRAGYNVFPITWDGTDRDNSRLANGVYLYRITAKTKQQEKNKTAHNIGKLIIAR
ncbi:MAG: type IX secretion system sortase PorU [candidate division KSB1 bacterium]|nr:type IX secretion system sortase PorU [candidate division KSB1 bacterium]